MLRTLCPLKEHLPKNGILLTVIPPTWTIWRAPTNASKWWMGFNSAFKGLMWASSELVRPWFVYFYICLDACTYEPDSVVTLATRYGLGGPGIESRWWRDFLHSPRRSPRPIQPPVYEHRVSFPGLKRPGCGAEVKEKA